jgi:hypothetical protein
MIKPSPKDPSSEVRPRNGIWHGLKIIHRPSGLMAKHYPTGRGYQKEKSGKLGRWGV